MITIIIASLLIFGLIYGGKIIRDKIIVAIGFLWVVYLHLPKDKRFKK